MTYIPLHRPAAATLALAALLASAAGGAQAAISVTDAKIEGGKLVVSGTASSGAQLRLDGQEGAAFNARAGMDGAFSFSLVYHPGDCVVTLNALVPPYLVAGESTEALVGNCGPAGVTAKGAWVEAAAYVRNDLVTHEGSTWRARRNNAGRTPAGGADWEVFAAAGEAATAPDADGTARVEPTGPAGGDLAGTYPNPTIRLLSIGSAKLGNGVVITEKLATNAVTTAKILDDTIRSLDIFNGTILSQDIADGTIAGIDVAINTITGDNIATNTILGGDIVNGTITGNDVGDGSLSGTDIADGSIGGIDLLDGTVGTVDIGDGAITSAKVLDDTLVGGGLAATDLAANSVGQSEIATDGVAALEIADNSIDSGEIVDFQLSNQDIGVLFAEVSGAGVLNNSSGGGVTVIKIAGFTGNYEVDFARNITACTAVATVGPAGAGSALGEVNVADRSANAEAVFVDTNTSAGAAADLPFRLVVVC